MNTVSIAQKRTSPPKGKRFLPPVYGHWLVGEIVVEDGDTLRPGSIPDLKEDELTLLPPGMHVSLLSETVSDYGDLVPVMTFWPPFPKESCLYGTTQFYCDGEGVAARLRANIEPLKAGFTLTVERDDWETYKAVGAKPGDVWYQIWHVGKDWIGYFFVAKDRQTMWTQLHLTDKDIIMPDGKRKKAPVTAGIFQVYRRLPAPTRK